MPELLPEKTISHYRIMSKIGAGGMGEVYLAQDATLDRKVALKILPADLASNREQRSAVSGVGEEIRSTEVRRIDPLI